MTYIASWLWNFWPTRCVEFIWAALFLLEFVLWIMDVKCKKDRR